MRYAHLLSILFAAFVATACQTAHRTAGDGVHPTDPLFQRVHTLYVAAVYNDEELQFRYRFPTENPSWYHGYRVYRGGEWTSLDGGAMGLSEDRISVMIDDGSVDGFDRYGAYLVARPGTSSYPDEAPRHAVAESFIGERGLGSEVHKYIPQSRVGDASGDRPVWMTARSEEELLNLRRRGVFLNTWQWRAHRSNPIGYADQGYVLEYRNSARGRGMYASNWDGDASQPLFMYDPERVGVYALSADRLLSNGYTQDDPYYLAEDGALPFDPSRSWSDGDILPSNYLREPAGSRGAVRAAGHWEDGYWNVRVRRSLEAPDPLDSKTLEHGESYNVQFAVHTGAHGGRNHLVSMPITMGLGAPGLLQAQRVDSALDDTEVDWLELPVVYPGIITLEELQSDSHIAAKLEQAVANPDDHATLEKFLAFVLDHEHRVMLGNE